VTDRVYLREAALTISRVVDGDYFARVDTTRITGLRISFSVVRTLDREPNDCSISVWNLNATTRAQLQARPLIVTLDAGHDGRLERVFSGDLYWVSDPPKLGSADQETRLQVKDGGRAYQHARVLRSYAGGVTVRAALADVARSMGLALKLTSAAEAALRAQFAGGTVLDGPSRDQMSRLLAPYDLRWSIQDGQLIVLGAKEFRASQPVKVSQETGMIGSPEEGVPDKEGEQPVITVRALLQPRSLPGDVVHVFSRRIRARIRADRVAHDGDTHGDTWQTTWEGKYL
jgi:hypothetical protein